MTGKTKSIHPIDTIVGRNIRIIRGMRGLSQTDLGKAIGVTFQQIQKVEKGSNRISASRMHMAAQFLKCSIADFYKGADELQVEPVGNQFSTEAVKAAIAYDAITDQKQRSAVLALMRSIAGTVVGTVEIGKTQDEALPRH